MELVYAALLLHKSEKEITSESLKKVMEAAGAQVDDLKIRALVAALDGVDIDQAIKEAIAVGATPTEASSEQASEEKTEEKTEEEKKEEEAKSAAGLGALFG